MPGGEGCLTARGLRNVVIASAPSVIVIISRFLPIDGLWSAAAADSATQHYPNAAAAVDSATQHDPESDPDADPDYAAAMHQLKDDDLAADRQFSEEVQTLRCVADGPGQTMHV